MPVSCECNYFPLLRCGATADGIYRDVIEDGITDASREAGAGGFNGDTRPPNNEQRKYAHRRLALALRIYGQRLELPVYPLEGCCHFLSIFRSVASRY
jgi:hypothetical protein